MNDWQKVKAHLTQAGEAAAQLNVAAVVQKWVLIPLLQIQITWHMVHGCQAHGPRESQGENE